MKRTRLVEVLGILILCAVFFAGCGSINEPDGKDSQSEETQSEETQSEEQAAESEGVEDEEWHTYTTRFAEVENVTCPTYSFDYPAHWSIVEEKCGMETGDEYGEWVVLSNGGNAKIRFIRWCVKSIRTGGTMVGQYQVSKISDSSFVPGYPVGTNTDFSYLGDFVVAKIEMTGFLQPETDSDFRHSRRVVAYAVLPESYIGEYEVVESTEFEETFSFLYPSLVTFMTIGEADKLTQQEKEEVFKILASFRVD